MKGMIKDKNRKFMKAALEEARKAFDKQEIPVGAVVVCNDMIIARAHNLTETLKDPTAHAEMQAITAATNWLGGKYLTDCTIYVTLEPCAMCAGAIGWSQASGLVYGAADEKKGFTNISGSSAASENKWLLSGSPEKRMQGDIGEDSSGNEDAHPIQLKQSRLNPGR